MNINRKRAVTLFVSLLLMTTLVSGCKKKEVEDTSTPPSSVQESIAESQPESSLVEGSAPLVEELLWYQKPFFEAADIQPSLVAHILSLDMMPYSTNTPIPLENSPYHDVSILTQDGKDGLIRFDGTTVLDSQYGNIWYSPDQEALLGDANVKITSDFSVVPIDSVDSVVTEDGGYFVWNEATAAIYFIGGTDDLYVYGPLYTESMIPVIQMSFDLNGMQNTDFSSISTLLNLDQWGFDASNARSYQFYQSDIESDPNQKRLFSYQKATEDGIKWGYASNRKLIAPCVYDSATLVHDGVGRVLSGGLWFYISPQGELINQKGFLAKETEITCYDFSEGLAAVSMDGKWGFVNREGDTVVSFQFEATRPVRQGLAWVKQDGLWGILNLKLYSELPVDAHEASEGVSSEIEPEETANPEIDYQSIYDSYLSGDSWKLDFIQDKSWKPAPETPSSIDHFSTYKIVDSTVLDLDKDGIPELWFMMQDPEFSGIKGKDTVTGFCTFYNGEVVSVLRGYRTGGSAGGSEIGFSYDTWNGTHVLKRLTISGGFGGSYERFEYFRYTSGTAEKTLDASLLSQSEQDFESLEQPYEQTGDIVSVYTVDDIQATSSEYHQAISQFIDPVSPEFELGTS